MADGRAASISIPVPPLTAFEQVLDRVAPRLRATG
jgi:hypothetical protein